MSLLSADEFFAGTVAVLARENVVELRVSEELDAKFERLFEAYVDATSSADVSPTFSFKRNSVHGDSRKLRETLYAARFDGIVSLENPSFYKMTTKLSSEEASYFVANIPYSDIFETIAKEVFADEIARSSQK